MKLFISNFKKLLLAVFPTLYIDKRTKRYMDRYLDEKDHNAIVFRDDIELNMKAFLSKKELNDKSLVDKITFDIVKCYILYGITPDEYFMYDFRNKKDWYRSTILSRKRKDELCCKYLGDDTLEYFMQLKDKWQFYNLSKPFFKRDVCRVEEVSDLIAIEEFCTKHHRFIVKPMLSTSGMGIHIVDLDQTPKGAKELLEYYQNLDDGKWIFEELIEQDISMAEWHASSVNTIRIPSIRTKKGCKVILPLFRTGKNGNVVDNCHNDGGLMSVPDAETGIILTDGFDIYNNVVETHPNSGLKFKDWQVPRWKELLETAEKLHMSLPSKHKYIGFDFALTKEGWVVVEGNWGNFPHQVCVERGIRKEFEKLMRN